MRVNHFISGREVILKINKYKIDWENDGNSSLERKFRDLVYPYWKGSIVLFQLTIPGCQLKIDFINCNKRLAVEIDGEQHGKFNKFFHNNSLNVWKESMKRDLTKYKWLEQNNIQILQLIQEDLDQFSPKYIQDKFNINIL